MLKNNKSELFETFKKEKRKNDLALLEAALYVAGRPLDWKILGSIIKTRSKKKIGKLIGSLMNEYKKRETALQIVELKDGRFVLELKGKLMSKVQKLATRPLISTGPLKTLAYITYRQPVDQAQVIDVRGHHAYNHLKQLEASGLVVREKDGRTIQIRTTDFFSDYFGLSHDLEKVTKQIKGLFENTKVQI